MKKFEEKLWEIAEFGPKTTAVLFIAGLILIFGFRDKLGWQIVGAVFLIFSSGETGKRKGYKEGYEKEVKDGRGLKE
jgi:hypothetical protein